jgi:hypothetical protein
MQKVFYVLPKYEHIKLLVVLKLQIERRDEFAVL